jgi:hypothetical protein
MYARSILHLSEDRITGRRYLFIEDQVEAGYRDNVILKAIMARYHSILISRKKIWGRVIKYGRAKWAKNVRSRSGVALFAKWQSVLRSGRYIKQYHEDERDDICKRGGL